MTSNRRKRMPLTLVSPGCLKGMQLERVSYGNENNLFINKTIFILFINSDIRLDFKYEQKTKKLSFWQKKLPFL